MTIKASGPISTTDIRTEFGGTGVISPSDYYRGGANVPDFTAGRVEIQSNTPTGTRSNVATSSGQNELLTIGLASDFDSGLGVVDFSMTLSGDGSSVDTGPDVGTLLTRIRFRQSFGSFSSQVRAAYDIPAGSQLSRLDGESAYDCFIRVLESIDGLTLTNEDTSPDEGQPASITPSWESSTLTLTIPGLGLAPSGITSIANFRMEVATDTVGSTTQIISTGFEGQAQDFSNTGIGVTSVTTGDTRPTTSFLFDPDVDNLVYGDGTTATGNFTANSDDTSVLTQLGNSIAGLHTDITWDGVISALTIPAIPSSITIDYTNAALDTSNLFVSEYFYGNWNTGGEDDAEFVFFFGTGTIEAAVDAIETAMNNVLDTTGGFTLTRNGLILTLSSEGRLSFTESSSATDGSTFNFSFWETAPVITQVLPTPGQTYADGDGMFNGGQDVFTGDTITVDLGTSQNIETMLTVTQNGGSNTAPTLSATDGVPGSGGGGVLSTYTVRDHEGSVVSSFTKSVASDTDNDLADVLSSVISIINTNTQTPMDFTAVVSNNSIVITASSVGAVAGVWMITAEHSTGDGDIEFGSTTITQEGLNVGTNGSIPTSGPISTANFYGATNGGS